MKNECKVTAAVVAHPKGAKRPVQKYIAIWDTGATNSVISKKVASECGLVATGKKKVFTPSGSSIRNTYLVDIILPQKVGIQGVEVTEGDLMGSDVLIGMDIIALGDFAVTNSTGVTKFTFRIPSLSDIDYVAIHRKAKAEEAAMQRRGPKQPGPKTKSKRKRGW